MDADSIEMVSIAGFALQGPLPKNQDHKINHEPILPIRERDRSPRPRCFGTLRAPSRFPVGVPRQARALFGPPALDLPTPFSFHFGRSPFSGLPSFFVPRCPVEAVKACLPDGVVWTPDIQRTMERLGREARGQDWLHLQWDPRSSHDETRHGKKVLEKAFRSNLGPFWYIGVTGDPLRRWYERFELARPAHSERFDGMILLQVVSSGGCAVYAEKEMIEFARLRTRGSCLNVGDGGEHIARAPRDPPACLFVYACYARLLRR